MSSLWQFLASEQAHAVESLISSLSALGVLVSVLAYLHSRKAAEKAAKDSVIAEQQANRSRLTEVYMSVHAHILRMEPSNVPLLEQMIRRGQGYVKLTGDGHMTVAIELLYMKLNAFFLEWHYRKLYGDMGELDRTIDHAMRGLATNPDPKFEPFVTNFCEIFADFPDEFRFKVYDRLISIRDGISAEEATRRRVNEMH